MLTLALGHKSLLALLCVVLILTAFQWWSVSQAEQRRMVELERAYWANLSSAAAEHRGLAIRYGSSRAAEAVAPHVWGVEERGHNLALVLSGMLASAALEPERVGEADLLWALSVFRGVADRALEGMEERDVWDNRRLARLTDADANERFDEICAGMWEAYDEERLEELFSAAYLRTLQRACD